LFAEIELLMFGQITVRGVSLYGSTLARNSAETTSSEKPSTLRR